MKKKERAVKSKSTEPITPSPVKSGRKESSKSKTGDGKDKAGKKKKKKSKKDKADQPPALDDLPVDEEDLISLSQDDIADITSAPYVQFGSVWIPVSKGDDPVTKAKEAMTAVVKANLDFDKEALILPINDNSIYPPLERGDAIPEDIGELSRYVKLQNPNCLKLWPIPEDKDLRKRGPPNSQSQCVSDQATT